MSIYSVQNLFCCCCGKEFQTRVGPVWSPMGYFDEAVCSYECLNEKKWREVLSMKGEPYRPYPKPGEEKEEKKDDGGGKTDDAGRVPAGGSEVQPEEGPFGD